MLGPFFAFRHFSFVLDRQSKVKKPLQKNTLPDQSLYDKVTADGFISAAMQQA
jgi:hypothetical protein